ncbi:Succinate--hydroxymethylglutarate CoA-transferase [Fulvia fulva]|uniref:Succinate--hydroxymethylglutarate CoA-transferase n=1 Tax=Passalora fulva TaxID=5499 RepID=A0A9Q8PF83_PASFU|nr:Succinate--hydroxymethylglutarate CoA-transferase [Fulvia fulva]KAK4618064.1 Succinate--hydroxymethylglutarate CoA-transferase [Fulvia fulva]KAK4619008.1 Succinate--hydroxymethylglutarate CoA-transferase [Fulvia fulva]UJO21334.1 Succinate--hydroxymethylglutarate CoA-transferase [Fulvia fulva]WPV18485.1 Succinate--hydroxymethylglutarate CoA-transferase [Fulvia fulva]WPV32969.1 Succinate--hydroxymethylglutarate CoA-transferase [Fulvia fulva]
MSHRAPSLFAARHRPLFRLCSNVDDTRQLVSQARRESFIRVPGTNWDQAAFRKSRSFSSSTRARDLQQAKQNDTASNLPLSGTLVVSLEQAIAGPFCTRQLADLGARVIKIERPGLGDFNRYHDKRVKGQCSHFVWTNRSKESFALDLKNPADLSALKTILSKADVLVQNLAPGATERMGLDYNVLKEKYPKLIVCDISGYGTTGPYKDKKAYDLLIQAESGFLSITGSPNQPAKAGCSIADIAAGTTAFNNILAALINRSKTGRGCRLDVSMLESMAEWMTFPLYYAYEGAEPPALAGAEHASIYPYGPFQCRDGVVMLGMQNEREWGIFAREVLGKGELVGKERFGSTAERSRNRGELKGIIDGVFSQYSTEEVLERLQRAGIANAQLNDMAKLWDHPQLKARNRWSEVDTPNGKIPALKPAGAAEGMEVRMDAIPSVGEHSEAILKEFGIER